MKSIEEIIKALKSYTPINDNWEDLDILIDKACSTKDTNIIKPLLSLFERYPEHDGYGAFWSIVHGLEGIGNYEVQLANSVLSKPHEMSIMMLNRMINGGINNIEGKPILEILNEVVENELFSNSVREQASHFIEHQQKNM